MKVFVQFLLVLTCTLCTSTSTAQEMSLDGPEAYEVLQISGEITSGRDPQEGVTVQLFRANKVIEVFETKKNGKFKFMLMSNEIYTIQLVKDGYYTKRISVNTYVPEDVTGDFDFDFDINVDSKKTHDYDPYLVEYPSAIISYSKKKKEFIFDKDYTESYFEDIENE